MKKIVIALLLLSSLSVVAQKERGLARKGNGYYADSAFVEAEVAYLKALDENPDMFEAQYNLASADMRQQKFDDAIEKYETMVAMSDDKLKTAELFHNMGNAYMSNYQASLQDQEKAKSAGEVLDKAIETYKKSLRHNPADDQTRYNLAVAQKLKEEGPPEQEQQDEQDKQDEEDKKDQDKKDQEQKDKEEQEQDQDNKDQQEQDQQKEQQSQPNEISKEDAEKILNAMMQDEKELQEEQKEKQKAAMRGKRVEKDW